MSWIEKLYQTYENNLGNIANPNDSVPLLPLFHSRQNAQIHVVIDGQGRFLDASVVVKDNALTIIPATEASAGRSGAKIAPHMLCDTLQ
jgi:CRISPR-associated protein Csd1